uniref:ATP synthase subunit e, mitochondrial n=1 Tax=Strongyloides venezuelensis TaxID=75913 RepID=A0A0K0F200_STRVS
MWTRIIQHHLPSITRYIALPLATVIGTIGYFVEKKYSKSKKIEILETSFIEQRNERRSKTLLDEDMDDKKDNKAFPNTLTVNS